MALDYSVWVVLMELNTEIPRGHDMALSQNSMTMEEQKRQMQELLDIIEELVEQGLEEFVGMVRFTPQNVAAEESGGLDDFNRIRRILDAVKYHPDHLMHSVFQRDLDDTTTVRLSLLRTTVRPLAA